MLHDPFPFSCLHVETQLKQWNAHNITVHRVLRQRINAIYWPNRANIGVSARRMLAFTTTIATAGYSVVQCYSDLLQKKMLNIMLYLI
jgi:hypothetical protein